MGPTRKRDLAVATVVAAILGYLLVRWRTGGFRRSRSGPGCRCWPWRSAEAGWAFYVRSKIGDGKIGDGPGWLHPLAVARAVMISKASAWVGALALGWWLGVRASICCRSAARLRVAERGHSGAVVAAVSALALVIAALWLQHCCKSPDEPPEDADGARELARLSS